MARKKMTDPRARGRRQNYDEQNVAGALPDEAYDFDLDGESNGISLTSMKKAARYMWIAIVFMLLCFGSIAGYYFLYNTTVAQAQNNCWLEQQSVEALANRYVTDNGFASLPAYVEDIPGYEQVYKPCPSGGGYTWNPVTGQFSCSEHGHYPNSFNKAQSQVQGTTTVTIPSNTSSNS